MHMSLLSVLAPESVIERASVDEICKDDWVNLTWLLKCLSCIPFSLLCIIPEVLEDTHKHSTDSFIHSFI